MLKDPLMKPENPSLRPVALWLAGVCLLIVTMVSVGGITRLTGSGLSIVEWAPILGTIPPLTAADWQVAFAKYQATPQFRILNSQMTMEHFKFIFFWEYIHRLLGRAIGVAYFFPLAWFAARGALRGPLLRRLILGLVLGGSQGALGWFMVKSGLVDRPHVSHFRLAAHLSLALVILSFLFWTLLGVWERVHGRPHESVWRKNPPGVRWAFWLLAGTLVMQIIYGAFVAGLKAGFTYNTWPKMNGVWLVPEAWAFSPAWWNFLENPAAVQFVHRWLAVGVVLAVLHLLVRAGRRSLPYLTLGAGVLLQFMLGVMTLVMKTPLTLAALHQFGACLLLLATLWVARDLRSRGLASQSESLL